LSASERIRLGTLKELTFGSTLFFGYVVDCTQKNRSGTLTDTRPTTKEV